MSLITLPDAHSHQAQIDVLADVAAATARVAPQWPLKHFVACNPFLGLTGSPFAAACETLAGATGSMPLLAPREYRELYERGEIASAHLAAVATPPWTVEALVAALDEAVAGNLSRKVMTIADRADSATGSTRWERFIKEEISKWCSVIFDENQTTWQFPWKGEEFYPAWRNAAKHDRNAEAFGLRGFTDFVSQLPEDAPDAISFCLGKIGGLPCNRVDFFHRELMTTPGWAAYLQYLAREDTMRGTPNFSVRDLLAIRLAYDAALAVAMGRSLPEAEPFPTTGSSTRLVEALCLWQAAYERAFQVKLLRDLSQVRAKGRVRPATIQAVFCIDVRSEVLRRHLEASDPSIQTLGFAGFFGFAVAHTHDGAQSATSRCPALLVPPVESHDCVSPRDVMARKENRLRANIWKAFQNSAASCFSFVETCGIASLKGLVSGSEKPRHSCRAVPPAFQSSRLTLEDRAKLAEGALRGMGLTQDFADLVLVCGHGSASANNPYASSLDCGACGGHAGDVNARLAVATLNDPSVREILASRSIVIPDTTVFIAGLHTTTTDTVELFDTHLVPASHKSTLVLLRTALATAGRGARLERAPRVCLNNAGRVDLLGEFEMRATDIAQTRPEWGLANNAAFIAAPRSRSSSLNLQGRAFLHDYDESLDPDGSGLTSILCAPAVVASWINLQYYASRVNPDLYGAGNKVLHNVVGGLGTFEGNGGDLKAGLPLQSLHDGEKFTHEPRRLTVVVEASRDRISRILNEQAGFRELVANEWIHIAALESDKAYLLHKGAWELVAA